MVKVIADSTCDLSQDLLERYGIDIIPLHIVMGDMEYEDGVDITPDEIYVWADANKTTPKTSAVAIDRVMDAYRPYLEAGNEIVCFAISTDMSTTANVMTMAAGELDAQDRVFVIDSANLSTGIGHQVIEAAIMAQNGADGRTIAGYMEEFKTRVRASFVVDTLTYLYRGGRCSGLAAMAGGVLKLHPRIEVVNGVMGAGKKYRGKMSTVIMDYVKDMEPWLRNARKDRVFITHSGCDEAIVGQVRSYLEGLNHFDEVLETRAGGVISSHCGPGTLGVLFVEDV